MFKKTYLNIGSLFFLTLSNFIGFIIFPERLIVTWVTLSLMAFFLGYLIIQLRSIEKRINQQQQASQELLKQEVSHYNDKHQQANASISNQFKSLKETINQIANITNSAAQKLSNSLMGLQHESNDQRELLHGLVEELVQVVSTSTQDEQVKGMTQFSNDTKQVIGDFTRTVHELKDSTNAIAVEFTTINTQISAVSNLLDDVNQITSQT